MEIPTAPISPLVPQAPVSPDGPAMPQGAVRVSVETRRMEHPLQKFMTRAAMPHSISAAERTGAAGMMVSSCACVRASVRMHMRLWIEALRRAHTPEHHIPAAPVREACALLGGGATCRAWHPGTHSVEKGEAW